MAYVFPAAQCDLDLSLEDKGLLNAITYSGDYRLDLAINSDNIFRHDFKRYYLGIFV